MHGKKLSLLEAGLFAGSIGDVVLQLANKTPYGNTGLKSYFDNQSSGSAILRASTLTGFYSWLYGELFDGSFLGFATFAAVIDIIYREYYDKLGFADLEDYYKMNSKGATIAYNVGAAAVVWYIADAWRY
jgi:hypothetical protein